MVASVFSPDLLMDINVLKARATALERNPKSGARQSQLVVFNHPNKPDPMPNPFAQGWVNMFGVNQPCLIAEARAVALGSGWTLNVELFDQITGQRTKAQPIAGGSGIKIIRWSWILTRPAGWQSTFQQQLQPVRLRMWHTGMQAPENKSTELRWAVSTSAEDWPDGRADGNPQVRDEVPGE